jgi:hypothetical protein
VSFTLSVRACLGWYWGHFLFDTLEWSVPPQRHAEKNDYIRTNKNQTNEKHRYIPLIFLLVSVSSSVSNTRFGIVGMLR